MASPKQPRAEKPGPKVEADRLAAIVLDAEVYGATKAAKKHGICLDTIRNYRMRIQSNPEALAIYRGKKKDLEAQWHDARIGFLLRAVDRLDRLLERCEVDQVRDVVGAIKIVGELHLVGGALGEGAPVADGEQPGTSRQGPVTPPDASGDGRGADPTPLH